MTTKRKEQLVLKALKGSDGLRWADLPDTIGFTTLHKMEKAGLIEQIANDAGPFSLRARWRIKGRRGKNV
jgi:hypothetical protein